MPDLNLNSEESKEILKKAPIFSDNSAKNEVDVDLGLKPQFIQGKKRNWRLIGGIGALVGIMIIVGLVVNIPNFMGEDGTSVTENLTGSFKQTKKKPTEKEICKKINGKTVCKPASSGSTESEDQAEDETTATLRKDDATAGQRNDVNTNKSSGESSVPDLFKGTNFVADKGQQTVVEDQNKPADTEVYDLKKDIEQTVKQKEAKIAETSKIDYTSSCGPNEEEGPPDPNTGQPTCIAKESPFKLDTTNDTKTENKKDETKAAEINSNSELKKVQSASQSAENFAEKAEKAKSDADRARQAAQREEGKIKQALESSSKEQIGKSIQVIDEQIAKISQALKDAKTAESGAEKALNNAKKSASKTIGTDKTEASKILKEIEDAVKTTKEAIESIEAALLRAEQSLDMAKQALNSIAKVDTGQGASLGNTSGSGSSATTSTSCTTLQNKINAYKTEVASTKLLNAEKEVVQYLLHKTILIALNEGCNSVSATDAKAAQCQNKEMFDTQAKACKSIPGYMKINSGEDNIDCTEHATSIAAIELKALDSDLDANDQKALATLKLDLSSYISYCQQAAQKEEESKKEEAKKSGGGGGAPAPLNDFDIENLQVIPEDFNPFVEQVKIHFFLTQNAYVSMEIIDESEVIKEFKEEKMNAGDRFIAWDGKKDDGGFVEEKSYDFKLIAKKATNKKNIKEEEGFVSVVYFDEQFELPDSGNFESVNGGVIFSTGEETAVSETSSGPTVTANTSTIPHGVASPLAQKILLEGQGKTITSETGPENMLYLAFIIPIYYLIWKPSKKH